MTGIVPVRDTSPDVETLLLQLESERQKSSGGEVRISKSIGGKDEFPKVTLIARMSYYCDNPIASVVVERTYGRRDTTCSLDDLEIRTACAYYLHLESPEDLNAIEKAVRAPTPKAWSFITLLDRMKEQTKELT